MRLLVCANRDFMANLALNYLWPELRRHTFDLVLSDGVGKVAPKAPDIIRWGAMERTLIEESLFPHLDHRDPASSRFRSFAGLASGSKSGEVRQFASLNRDEGLAYVRAFVPDVIVSIRFGQIFKAPVIGIPRLGVINLHSGLLPNYRGILATFWAMLNGETHAGCTLHYVSDGSIDTGDVIGIHTVPIDRSRSVLWNVASLYEGGTVMITSALTRLSTGQRLETAEQKADGSAYYSYPREEDMQVFLRTGGRLYTEADYRELIRKYDVPDHVVGGFLRLQ